jgi:hypothetical protein
VRSEESEECECEVSKSNNVPTATKEGNKQVTFHPLRFHCIGNLGIPTTIRPNNAALIFRRKTKWQ